MRATPTLLVVGPPLAELSCVLSLGKTFCVCCCCTMTDMSTVLEEAVALLRAAADEVGRKRRAMPMTARELLRLAADSAAGQPSSSTASPPNRKKQRGGIDLSAAAAWKPFDDLLRSRPPLPPGSGDKLTMPAEYFLFGNTKAFMEGLPGLLEGGGLRRSMAEEARANEGGRWWDEFRYVVERAAEEDVADLPSTNKFKGKYSVSGELIVRDRGHAGMTLARFCEHEMVKDAELTPAEVAAIRLYSGPMFAPLNYALRTEQIADWATTIACCYSGVLKLSFKSQPARVYRGVKEDTMQLPPEFLNGEEGKFAGGVERAFTSTTKSAAVALDYSGGGETAGSIFVIDFDMNSRGASIQWLSQYPHEEELLFPPCTGLACLDVSQHDRKKCIRVSAQVSTAKLDTREMQTPDDIPGAVAASTWVAAQLHTTTEELATLEQWDLSKNRPSLKDPEALAKVVLLLGRAGAKFAVRHLDLRGCALSEDGVKAIAEALKMNDLMAEVHLDGNSSRPLPIQQLKGTDPVESLDLSKEGLGSASASAILIGALIDANASITSLDLCFNMLGSEGAKALASGISANASVTRILVSGNCLGDAGATILCEALRESKMTNVQELELSYNRIGPEGAKAVAAMAAVVASLTSVR